MAWTHLKDQIAIDDIGARLLANLAKGIYSHEAVLREYVQNACDAYEQLAQSGQPAATPQIRIDIDGNSLSIWDGGIGMNEKGIRAAKKIAVSPKAGENLTGFRGIGIWAGFQACDSLEVVTTRRGDTKRYRLTINFKDILKHVNDDINIKELLDGRFRLEADAAPSTEHYTHVTLRGLHKEYEKLLDIDELRRIAAQNLPCRIDPKFKYKAALEELFDSCEGYQEYPFIVGQDEVFKDLPDNVDPPRFETLKDGAVELCKVWWCPGWGSLKLEGSEYRGFRLRVRNFAVGRIGIYDDEDGSPYGVPEPQLKIRPRLNWHVGELHITHPDVIPDTPRTHLELDALSRTTIAKIRAFYADRIAEAGARSEFNQMREFQERCDAELKAGSMSKASAESALAELYRQDLVTHGKPSTTSSKRQLRQLLGETKIKMRRRALMKDIEAKYKISRTSVAAKAKKKASGKASKTTTAKKSSSTAAAATVTAAFDFEGLLSEILEIVTAKVTEDVATEMAEALQQLFAKKQLLEQ